MFSAGPSATAVALPMTIAGMQDFCSLIANRARDASGEWAYRTVLWEAARVTPSDSPEQKREKIRRTWNLHLADLRCTVGAFDLAQGGILRLGVFHNFDEFLADVREWGVELNAIDPGDNRTLLDYIIDRSNANRGSDIEIWYNDQHDRFREAGAKHASEIGPYADAIPRPCSRRFILPGRRVMCALLGAASLGLGVSAPALDVPIFGEIAYIQYATAEGSAILVLALFSLLAAVLGKFRWLWITGLGTCGALMTTFLRIHDSLEETRAQAAIQPAGHPMRELAEAAIQLVSFQWGWVILVLGVLLVLLAAGAPGRRSSPPMNKEGLD